MVLSNQIIDSHCHLDFFDEERGAIIKRAEKAGIKNIQIHKKVILYLADMSAFLLRAN